MTTVIDWSKLAPRGQPREVTPTPMSLLRDIEGTNNGYLFVPTVQEVALARAFPALFVVRPGDFPPLFAKIYTRATWAVHTKTGGWK